MRTLALHIAVALMLAACATTDPLPQAPPAPLITAAHHSAEPDQVDDPPRTLYPIFDDTPLHIQPAHAAAQIDTLAAQGRLIRFRTRGQWAKVLHVKTGRMGWAENRLLTSTPPEKSLPPGSGTISETF